MTLIGKRLSSPTDPASGAGPRTAAESRPLARGKAAGGVLVAKNEAAAVSDKLTQLGGTAEAPSRPSGSEYPQLVGARGFDPAVPTPRIVVPEAIEEVLRGVA